jgi:thymidylate synthase ThyX
VTKEIAKWADSFMFEAEKSDASAGPKAYLLGGPVDPLGQIAACAKMYKGEVVRDLADVTNEERVEYLEQIQKSILAMPLEAVTFHFMLEGVHRGITHQLVRQRTAAFAQESTRFAVKRDMKEATALPPSLKDTLPLDDLVEKDIATRIAFGLEVPDYDDETITEEEFEAVQEWKAKHRIHVRDEVIGKGGPQARRLRWDEMVDEVSQGYNWLIDDGMPAEEARGIMPTNITTRLNYITNLRNFLTEMSKRLSDQAQFEWREVAMAYALAMREFGAKQFYWTTVSFWEYQSWQDDTNQFGPIYERNFMNENWQLGHESDVRIKLSSEWQYISLTEQMRPADFVYGKRAFAANFDRPSRIGERVDAFASLNIPSSEWTKGSIEYGIPPIHPAEWLFDPNSARLESGMEFDIFGNRVPVGTGWHWMADYKILKKADGSLARWPQDFQDAEGGES